MNLIQDNNHIKNIQKNTICYKTANNILATIIYMMYNNKIVTQSYKGIIS